MEKILFIDACIRGENSRTKLLAQYFLNEYQRQHFESTVDTVNLNQEVLSPLTEETLLKRETLLSQGDLQNEMFYHARKFQEADTIFIAAPFWDLNFPSILKVYFEHICVNHITFHYDEKGNMVGDCKADKLLYITTRGGKYAGTFLEKFELGGPYIEALTLMFGIKKYESLFVEELDVLGIDVKKQMEDAFARAKKLASVF